MQKFDVFFSHSTRRDPDTAVEEIMEAAYACITSRDYRVFWDRRSAEGGRLLPSYLDGIIRDCKVAVHFLTSHWTTSEWTDHERNVILDSRIQKKLRVVGVLLNEQIPYEPWLDPGELLQPRQPLVASAIGKQICDKVVRLLQIS